MNKHTWSALAILVMAILALGSTDNSSSSPTASTIPAPKKIPPANSVAPLESQASQPKSEVDQIFAERMALYEKDLAAWNQLSELRNTLDTQRSDLQTRIKAIESEPPTPPPENEERDWSSIDQKFRTVGVLIQTDYKVATIKKADGKIVTVPKEKFIDEDRRYIENAFVETEVFRKNLAKWNESKSALTVELFTIQNRITAAYNSKPVLPNKQSIENEISAQRLKQEYERRLEKEAEARRMAADEHDQKLKKTLADFKKAEEEFEQNGLVLLQKSISAKVGSHGGQIKGIVENRRNRKFAYVQITFNLYDSSGARVGTALANINGLEPGERWKFEALILEENVSSYKIDNISSF